MTTRGQDIEREAEAAFRRYAATHAHLPFTSEESRMWVSGYIARAAAPRPELEPSTPELISNLRKAINAAIFGIPPEAITAVQADLSELARRLEQK